MDRFVCVRIVQANTIDLNHFQFDFDQSFAAFLMNADWTIYARFGTRSDRPEAQDISLQGLRKAMQEALRMHADLVRIKPILAGKQVNASRYRTPRDYPGIAERYQPTLDYSGKTAQSCMHCHQVRDAERRVYRDAREPIPDPVLYPYPDPSAAGMTMDPEEMATVARVAAGSPAEQGGVRPGDRIKTLDGQPLLSIADLQWVLHNTAPSAELPAVIERNQEPIQLTLKLPEGWRRGDLSWRVTTWELRRMALGGMRLDDLTDNQRAEQKRPRDAMALRVRHVGEFGAHAVAKRAGLQRDDMIVGFDGQEGRMTESDVLAYALQQKRPGDEVTVTVLRGSERKSFKFVQQ
jgi:hypothetical protein